MNYTSITKILFGFVILVLLVMSTIPVWSMHLQTDLNVHYERARHIVTNGNFSRLEGNEYQPGALFFFASLSPFLLIKDSVSTYTFALFFVNICLLASLAILYRRVGNAQNSLLFVIILIFTGPIILFRFEPFVMFLVVLSLYFYLKLNKPLVSASILGVATLVKIFPVAWLPYFLILAWNKNGWKAALWVLASFVGGYLGFYLLFLVLFQASPTVLFESFAFLRNCPIHTESLWGTLTTLFSKVTTGEYARGVGSWGIFGIAPNAQIGPLAFYNVFLLVPISLFYLYLFLRKNSVNSIYDIRIIMIAVMLFLGFGKIIHHQYTLWFMLLLPLLPLKLMLSNWWRTNIFMVLLMSVLHQYIYPLQYFNFIEFYTTGANSHLFWIITLRNLLFVALLIRLLYSLMKHPEAE